MWSWVGGVAAVEEPFCCVRAALGVPLSEAIALGGESPTPETPGYPPLGKGSPHSSPPPPCWPEHNEWTRASPSQRGAALFLQGGLEGGQCICWAQSRLISFPWCQQPVPNVPLTQGPQWGSPLAHLALPVAAPWGQLPARDTVWALIRWNKIP